tara:strand:- start:5892 stop:6605 length:714 start_codon:yes stop_codon:yes gene_type:complete
MNAVEKLIAYWGELDLGAPSRVHPADLTLMDPTERFDTAFVPYPYIGDIRGADVWVLMLNSNIGPEDAKQEAEPYFADRLRSNLTQDFDAYQHPLLSLDPKLRHTGTYEYYNKRNGIAKLIAELARRSGVTERAARCDLARRLAIVQLFPYRSTSGVPRALRGGALASVRFAKAAVAEALESKLVVVPRSARDWGFEYGVRGERLITFAANQARSASLKPDGACGGGDAILHRLMRT